MDSRPPDNVLLFRTHLRTHPPPQDFSKRNLHHPFYQQIDAYLAQTTRGHLLVNDLRPAFSRLFEATFVWLRSSSACGVAIQHPESASKFTPLRVRDSDEQLAEDLSDVYDIERWRSNLTLETAQHTSTQSNLDVDVKGWSFAKPGLWLTAWTSTYAGANMPPDRWQIASLLAEIHYFNMWPQVGPPTKQAKEAALKARDALGHAMLHLARTNIEAGTFMSLAMVNSLFSRLCIVDRRPRKVNAYVGWGSWQSKSRQPPHRSPAVSYTDVITIALEVSDATLQDYAAASIDHSELLESHLINPLSLFAHDLVQSYDLTGNPLDDLTTHRYTLNHDTVETLWTTLCRAVKVIGRLPLARPLERLPPPSPQFLSYIDNLISESIPISLRPERPDCTLRSPRGTIKRVASALRDASDSGSGPDSASQAQPVSDQDDDHSPLAPDATEAIRQWIQSVESSPGLESPVIDNSVERRIHVRFVSTTEMDRLLELRCHDAPVPPTRPSTPPPTRPSTPPPSSFAHCCVLA